MGAKVKIVTIPGYLPMINNRPLMELFTANAAHLVGESNVKSHPETRNRGGSTDMGDLSHVMPVIHPYTVAATGSGHGIDCLVRTTTRALSSPPRQWR